MEIKVNEQPKQFYLAVNDWIPVIGHEVTIGEHRFCICALETVINVSEVTSGARIFNVPIDIDLDFLTETKGDTMKFYYLLAKKVKEIIANQKNFLSMIEEMKNKSVEKLGEMPPIIDIDEKMILANTGDITN